MHIAPCAEQKIPIAIVLDGVPDGWQMNVLQVLATSASALVTLDGPGTIRAPALLISPDQARHLATQIAELLGLE